METAAGILFIAVLIYIGVRKGMKEGKAEDAVRQQKEAQGIYRFGIGTGHCYFRLSLILNMFEIQGP